MVVYKDRAKANFAAALSAALDRIPDATGKRRRAWMAKKWGVSTETARKWLDALAMPDTARMPKIAADLGVSVESLLFPAPMGVAEPIYAYCVKTDEDPLEDGDVRVDVLDVELAAGGGTGAPEFVETKYRHTFRSDWLRSVGVRDSTMIKRCKVRGDSMERILFHGDVVTIDGGNRTKIVDEGIYAIYVAGQLKVKRLMRTRDGGLVIRSENTITDPSGKRLYPDETVPAPDLDQVLVIGRVIDKSGQGGLGF